MSCYRNIDEEKAVEVKYFQNKIQRLFVSIYMGTFIFIVTMISKIFIIARLNNLLCKCVENKI